MKKVQAKCHGACSIKTLRICNGFRCNLVCLSKLEDTSLPLNTLEPIRQNFFFSLFSNSFLCKLGLQKLTTFKIVSFHLWLNLTQELCAIFFHSGLCFSVICRGAFNKYLQTQLLLIVAGDSSLPRYQTLILIKPFSSFLMRRMNKLECLYLLEFELNLIQMLIHNVEHSKRLHLSLTEISDQAEKCLQVTNTLAYFVRASLLQLQKKVLLR